MDEKQRKDSSYLKGDYEKGFYKIIKALKADIIQESFKKEVEDDILELFIRNQDNKVDFNEVIGGDMDEFIRNIVDVYLEETPIKTKFYLSLTTSLFVTAVFGGFNIIVDGKATLAHLVLCGVAMIIVLVTNFLCYKISKKINPKYINYISGGVGFVLAFFSEFLYKKTYFLQLLNQQEIDLPIAMGAIALVIIMGFITMKKMNHQNFKEV